MKTHDLGDGTAWFVKYTARTIEVGQFAARADPPESIVGVHWATELEPAGPGPGASVMARSVLRERLYQWEFVESRWDGGDYLVLLFRCNYLARVEA